jgi:hypothetical protein
LKTSRQTCNREFLRCLCIDNALVIGVTLARKDVRAISVFLINRSPP